MLDVMKARLEKLQGEAEHAAGVLNQILGARQELQSMINLIENPPTAKVPHTNEIITAD